MIVPELSLFKVPRSRHDPQRLSAQLIRQVRDLDRDQ